MERIGNRLEITGIDHNLPNRTPMDHQLRKTNDKWSYMELKFFYTEKNCHQTVEVGQRMGEKHRQPMLAYIYITRSQSVTLH
jgi:hypothetical protein